MGHSNAVLRARQQGYVPRIETNTGRPRHELINLLLEIGLGRLIQAEPQPLLRLAEARRR